MTTIPQNPSLSLLEPFFRRRLDPSLERLMGRVMRLRLEDPLKKALAEVRQHALRETLRTKRDATLGLGARLSRRDPDAVREFDAIVDECLREMREAARRHARSARGSAMWSRAEERLYVDAEEVMDDPNFPADARADALDVLDRLNQHAGSYGTFVSILLPLIEEAERRGHSPVRIHDCAAGHGGFALHLKRAFGDRVTLEASDIRREYLALGRSRARELGLDVDFFEQDAFALDGLRDRRVDIISCTQSLHHWSPGMVSRLVGETSRAARVGTALIDGERSWLTFALLAIVSTLYGRTYAFVHDALVSIRRMFYREELALLSALAPGVPPNARVVASAAPPVHIFVRTFIEET